MAAKNASKAKATKKGTPKAAKATAPVVEQRLPPKPASAARPAGTVDPRLPAVGTTIQKRDRAGHVRCSCEVIADGIKYAGTVYSSLSGAAMAAARDLGLTNKTQNGYVFWGLSKPQRPAADAVEALQRAWQRYQERAKEAVAAATDESREGVRYELGKQAEAIEALARRAA